MIPDKLQLKRYNDYPEIVKPRRIQRRRTEGWRMPPNTVSVTRWSKYCNPFIVGEVCDTHFGSYYYCGCGENTTKEHAYFLFEEYARSMWTVEEVQKDLRGKHLACWCKTDDPYCHAGYLLKVANR